MPMLKPCRDHKNVTQARKAHTYLEHLLMVKLWTLHQSDHKRQIVMDWRFCRAHKILLRFPELKSQACFQKCPSLTTSFHCLSSAIARVPKYPAREKIFGNFFVWFCFGLGIFFSFFKFFLWHYGTDLRWQKCWWIFWPKTKNLSLSEIRAVLVK